MPRSLRLSSVWAISLLLATPALAGEPESKPLAIDGQPGIWFPMPKARKLLEDVTQMAAIKQQLDLISQRLDLEKTRTGLLQSNLDTTGKIADLWKETAADQAKQLATRTPWWHSPYLWLTVGFVAGTGVTIAIVQAVKHGAN